jgi:hypothetical protein
LIARITIQKSATNFGFISNTLITPMSATSVNTHNNLGGLQGGTTDEYYHLTSAQNTRVAAMDQDVAKASDVEFASILVSKASGLDGATPVTVNIYSTSNGTWTDEVIFSQLLFGTADTSGTAGSRCAVKAYIDDTTGADAGLSFWTTTAGSGAIKEQMRIDHTGKVGIGNITPNTLLDVTGGDTGATTALLTLRSNFSDNATGTTLRMANSTSATSTVGTELTSLRTNNGGTGYTDFIISTYTGSLTEKMRILANGNTGFGTATAVSLMELQGGLTTTGAVLTLSSKETTTVADDILGRINFRAALDGAGGDAVLRGASIAAIAENTFSATVNETGIQFSTAASELATEKMRLDHHGNLGIGVTAPTAYLHLKAPTTGFAQIRLAASSAVDVASPNSGDLWWNGTNLYFYNGSANKDLLAGGSGTPAGNDGDIQKNDSGSFGAIAPPTFDESDVSISNASAVTSFDCDSSTLGVLADYVAQTDTKLDALIYALQQAGYIKPTPA